MNTHNPLGLKGIQFVEFCSQAPERLEKLFYAFGFSKIAQHQDKNCALFTQNEIQFLLNQDKSSFAASFEKQHGPCAPSMGWKVENAKQAHATALQRGAKDATTQDYYHKNGTKIPAIQGVGGSLIYFIEDSSAADSLHAMGFHKLERPVAMPTKGFRRIDHLTNNVEKGMLQTWASFYKDIFGFTEIRYFDIKGLKTGLISFALQSPDKSFCIPINEGTEDKSQINEYLREYKGPGIQHIAFLTDSILDSLAGMEQSGIETLDIDADYYDEVFKRVPHVTEDKKEIQRRQVLVDGDEEGYLLQIFTKNVIGPIFIELIQRKNHYSFGEGNFGALFRAIEKDQQARGTL